MRVTKLEVPDGNSFGLKSITMDRLGQVVVLAGKNGAGKTRLLKRLFGWSEERFGIMNETRAQWMERFKQENPNGAFEREKFGAWLRNKLDPYRFPGPQLQKFEASFYKLEFDSSETPRIAAFVPTSIILTDTDELSSRQIREKAESATQVGAHHLASSTLPHIQQIQTRYWNATHQKSSMPEADRDLLVKGYEQLASLVQRFLGASLARDSDGNTTLYGFPLGKAPLSDGQKVLLQFCVAMHAQGDRLSDLIVVMDEPENHLHPGAVLDAIERIQPELERGQLWIATHSVPLLAHFDPESTWWVEDGSVKHAGSIPERVLSSLIGDDERIARLSDFLGLPAALAANHFAYQCLLPPEAVVTSANDPQTGQIARLLDQHRPGVTLRVLDFGAGRGRLISALHENGDLTDALQARLDYRAFEPDVTHHSDCETAILRALGSAENRLFHDDRTIRGALDPKSVDVIVMCNVLHEIDVTEWQNLFSADKLLRILLRDDGFLLVVEDTEMRIGERAHQRGFLVLDKAGLKRLFQIGECEEGFLCDTERDGRLQAHLVPARCLSRMTSQSLLETLKQARELAMGEVKRLRSKRPDYRAGRQHAFYVQQLANAQMGLNALGE